MTFIPTKVLNINDSVKEMLDVFVMFFFCRNESWWSALKFCQDKGGSLPELHTRDDIMRIMDDSNIMQEEGSHIIYTGLYWVRYCSKSSFLINTYMQYSLFYVFNYDNVNSWSYAFLSLLRQKILDL